MPALSMASNRIPTFTAPLWKGMTIIAYSTTATVFIETYRLDVRCCIPCGEAVHRAYRAYKP